jgi:hypothetical protein
MERGREASGTDAEADGHGVALSESHHDADPHAVAQCHTDGHAVAHADGDGHTDPHAHADSLVVLCPARDRVRHDMVSGAHG